MADDRKATLVHISGRVQGVSFRIWTKTQAQRFGLTGWVRNEDDGSVTALIAGQDAAVSAMLEQFWNGPVGASVSSVVTKQASLDEAPSDFRITS
ncbi:acylphosphatase [Rhizobium sp. SEMIA 4085]|uniref:Acylphosphatase n=1 Tax=Rhizobium gallicum bv. gallicum R602sp TaxID=1041138 RepID=A0A0B4XH82_9HYPH|nr:MULTISPECIES: acylphosphatase [Rhizobium]AJD45943.1 acylphosphatase [Rhizobium gallicum bv. gallicum R602sp]NNH30940.1 acylphosphatase [Rhizobium sp. SEMIA 4085]TDW32244.1 acylphosphatase [Rhizobium azibense]